MSLPAITVPNAAANLAVGRGVVSWSTGVAPASPTFVDLGNSSSVQWSPNAKTLEHYSSRSGMKTRDMLIPYEYTGELKIKLEEIIPYNLKLAFMGSVAAEVTTGMNQATFLGQIQFVGANPIGWKFTWLFPSVSLMPGGALDLIGDTWQELELHANVQAYDNGTDPPYMFTATRTG